MLEAIKEAINTAWSLLFGSATTFVAANATNNTPEIPAFGGGIVIRFMGFLQAHPILLLPLGFYLIFLGIKTTRKLVTGY